VEAPNALSVHLALLQLDLCEFRQGEQSSALGVEVVETDLNLLQLELLSHLDAIHRLQREVEFLVKLLDDLVLHHSIGAPQRSLIAFTRTEG
jgi:hypothetical protein